MKVTIKLDEKEIKRILEQHVACHPHVGATGNTRIIISQGDPGDPRDPGPTIVAEVEATMTDPPVAA